jgi:hypothetical protein
MAGIGRYRLSDALRPPRRPAAGDKGGKASRTHKDAAEQTREAQEGVGARRAGVSVRDRMVDIGRGNQQAGRQGS